MGRQAWAVLEDRVGNTGKARKLFDAATAADRTHPAAWHGWAVLELREGNTKKARALLKKGLKFHGPNEYLLQTLALLDVKMGRYDQARILFGKATRSNPKSAASWLVHDSALTRRMGKIAIQKKSLSCSLHYLQINFGPLLLPHLEEI